jgi:hypothetical protein
VTEVDLRIQRDPPNGSISAQRRIMTTIGLLGIGLSAAFPKAGLFGLLLLRGRVRRPSALSIGFLVLAVLLIASYLFGREIHFDSEKSLPGLAVETALYSLFAVLPFIVEQRLARTYWITVVLGISLVATWVVAYSFFTDPLSVAVRTLVDPITGAILNSPQYANWLALGALVLTVGRAPPLYAISILVVASISAVMLQNRTGTVLCALTLLTMLLGRASFRHKYAWALAISASASFLVFSSALDDFAALVDVFVSRWNEEGISSPRWTLNMFALSKFSDLAQPLGGLTVQQNEYGTRWFHNLVFDSYATAGLAGATLALATLVSGLAVVIVPPRNWGVIVATVACVSVLLTSVPLEDGFWTFVLFCILVSFADRAKSEHAAPRNDL